MSDDCERVAELIHLIHRRKISDTHRAVLTAMAIDANPVTGYMQLSIERLAWLLDKSESQARRDLQSVVNAGLLAVIKASKGRFPSIYVFNPVAAEPKEIKRGSERVDYTQPTTNTVDDDRVSDSQPTIIEGDGDRDDRDDRVGATLQIIAGNGRDDRVVPFPPKNPPIKTNTKAVKDATNAARAPVDDLLDWLKIKDPMRQFDRADLEKQMQLFTAEWVRDAFEQGYSKPKLDSPMGYMINTCKGWLANGKPDKTPPSVPGVSPSANGVQPSPSKQAQIEAERIRVQRQRQMEERQKASGQ